MTNPTPAAFTVAASPDAEVVALTIGPDQAFDPAARAWALSPAEARDLAAALLDAVARVEVGVDRAQVTP